MWSPTGKARGTLLHAPVGRHPGQTLAHSSTARGRGLLLPGSNVLPAAGRQSPNEIPISNDKSPHLVNGGEED
jgi:hypothetical protein